MHGEQGNPPEPPRLAARDPWIDVEEARRQRAAIVWSQLVQRLDSLRRRSRVTTPASTRDARRPATEQES